MSRDPWSFEAALVEAVEDVAAQLKRIADVMCEEHARTQRGVRWIAMAPSMPMCDGCGHYADAHSCTEPHRCLACDGHYNPCPGYVSKLVQE